MPQWSSSKAKVDDVTSDLYSVCCNDSIAETGTRLSQMVAEFLDLWSNQNLDLLRVAMSTTFAITLGKSTNSVALIHPTFLRMVIKQTIV
jgi:hypothetical protein